MFYNIFITTFLVLLAWTFVKATPDWKNNHTTIYKVLHCLTFMMVQSVCIAGIIMIIYNIWK